jgi:uncharacterized membrane protein YdjX (TVP38/TMEM64 family)
MKLAFGLLVVVAPSLAFHVPQQPGSSRRRIVAGPSSSSTSLLDGRGRKNSRHVLLRQASRSDEKTATSSGLAFWKQGETKVVEPDRESGFPMGMMDLTKMIVRAPVTEPVVPEEEQDNLISPAVLLVPVVGLLVALGAAVANSLGITGPDVINTIQLFFHDPQATLQTIVEGVKSLGPSGPLYFGFFYMLCEIVAIPATPLALSAGYLFGLEEGVLVVLAAATVAAVVGFGIGRTLLRSWVEGLLTGNPQLQKLDKAVGKSGFKILVLLRLSPIIPFSISNYIYGASSINFPAYFWGTFLGFIPGTIGYVYSGMVGQELLSGHGTQPWYVYAGGAALLLGVLKVVADVAGDLVESMEDAIIEE